MLAEDGELWNDPQKAQDLMRERQSLEDQIAAIRRLTSSLDDGVGLIQLGEEEGDEGVVSEAEASIRDLKSEIDARQIETMLSGEADKNDAYLEVHAGAGGTESQDWANMLLRMYTRWAERRKFKVEVLELHDGEEAGIKSATLHIKGHNAYGWLKTESGVHRLVRISPYDSNARRHTSFASVWVYPVIDDSIEIDAFMTGDQQVELIDALVAAVVAGFALFLGPVLQRHFLGYGHVLIRQLGYVVQ